MWTLMGRTDNARAMADGAGARTVGITAQAKSEFPPTLRPPGFACITAISAIVPQSRLKIEVEVFGDVFTIQARPTADIAGHRIQQA
jgi:hypothetical protein